MIVHIVYTQYAVKKEFYTVKFLKNPLGNDRRKRDFVV